MRTRTERNDMTKAACAIGIIMGSRSDWETMQHAAQALDRLGIAYETRIMSAHRTPERLFQYAREAQGRGLKAIIAGAGGAAHLPGVAAALTPLPVLGVPIESQALGGLDSLLSIVQMPAGVPVATFAIGRAGAVNAALFAAAMLGLADPATAAAVDQWRRPQAAPIPGPPPRAMVPAPRSAAASPTPHRATSRPVRPGFRRAARASGDRPTG